MGSVDSVTEIRTHTGNRNPSPVSTFAVAAAAVELPQTHRTAVAFTWKWIRNYGFTVFISYYILRFLLFSYERTVNGVERSRFVDLFPQDTAFG